MGLDLTLQAFPENVRRYNVSRTEDLVHEMARLVYRRTEPSRWKTNPSAEVSVLLKANPGIEGRNIDLGRNWDKLAYLIAESRRYHMDHDSDLGWIAIRGERALGQIASQGVPVRYTDPRTVRNVLDYLEGLNDEDLRALYDPTRMGGMRIYKFGAESACDAEREALIDLFHDLREFYRQVAVNRTRGEGVLVYLD